MYFLIDSLVKIVLIIIIFEYVNKIVFLCFIVILYCIFLYFVIISKFFIIC